MKKMLSLLLALMLILSLTACNGIDAETSAKLDEILNSVEAIEAKLTTEVSSEDGPSEIAEEAPEEDVIICDPLTITFNETHSQEETSGKITQFWADTIAELTGGAISTEIWWGATVYGDGDILEGLGSGAVNMAIFSHMPHTGTLNYLAFPGFAPGDPDIVLEMFNAVCFDNEETAALVQQELADNGIYFIENGVQPGGTNAFCATYEFDSLDTLVAGSTSFGNFDAPIFEELGFQVSTLSPPDTYDGLQRGLINSTQMALAPMVSMQWYAVAPYWALDGTYAAGNFFAANLDWWNNLSAEQQEAINIATAATVEYAKGLYNDSTDADIALIESETGNAFVKLSDEDIARIWAASFEAKASAAMGTAINNGKEAGMKTILELCAEITGYDWSYES